MYFFTSECRGFLFYFLQHHFWDVQKQDVIIQLCVTAGGRQLVVPMVWRDTRQSYCDLEVYPPHT